MEHQDNPPTLNPTTVESQPFLRPHETDPVLLAHLLACPDRYRLPLQSRKHHEDINATQARCQLLPVHSVMLSQQSQAGTDLPPTSHMSRPESLPSIISTRRLSQRASRRASSHRLIHRPRMFLTYHCIPYAVRKATLHDDHLLTRKKVDPTLDDQAAPVTQERARQHFRLRKWSAARLSAHPKTRHLRQATRRWTHTSMQVDYQRICRRSWSTKQSQQ